MSRDIRSFFNAVPKGDKTKQILKKPIKIIDSDDEDKIEVTPEVSFYLQTDEKPSNKSKRRNINVISSDSDEDDAKSVKKLSPKTPKMAKISDKPLLKPVDIEKLNIPIKQSSILNRMPKSEVKNPEENTKKTPKKKIDKKRKKETEIHNDEKFAKTLDHLDEDNDDDILLNNMDILDKTLEEAVTSKEKFTKTKNSPEKKAEKRLRKNSETDDTPSKKKAKLEQFDSGIDPDLSKLAKKRDTTGNFLAFLHRGAPKHRGQKEYPQGKPNCLAGLTLLRTGVLDSLEAEEFDNLVTSHGGKVVRGVSKKVNYMVVGEEPGPSKLEKSRSYKIPEMSEDEFLDLILVKSGLKPKYACQSEQSEDFGIGSSVENFSDTESTTSKANNNKSVEIEQIETKIKIEDVVPEKKIVIDEPVNGVEKEKIETKIKIEDVLVPEQKIVKEPVAKKIETIIPKTEITEIINKVGDNVAWTEKYKPTKAEEIIGQNASNSNMNKLKQWLQNWFKNAKLNQKPNGSYRYDGAGFKAALLSGSPGIGKTTTATLVAKEMGFDVVEFNASDTRSKKLLHDEISRSLKCRTVSGYFSAKNDIKQRRVLIMDEVDGMAGNQDRGGIAELISFIKTTSFPIICMCNDRETPKMRSLVNYCFALKFTKPTAAQIKGKLLSICFKEGLTIKSDALTQLIMGTDCDIRQSLNHLSMWTVAEKNLSLEQMQKESKNSQKDVVIGTWDVVRKTFSTSENKDMTLHEKLRLFFYDYSFVPLFIQENYITVRPTCTGPPQRHGMETLLRRHLVADSLSQDDIVDTKIRSTNNWSLLEQHGFLSTVIPSYYLSGQIGGIRFPAWLGKNSQRNKSLRIIGEIHSHCKTRISGDKFSVRFDYAEPLVNRLVDPLLKNQNDGVDETLEILKSYSLLRDDLTNLCDLITCFGKKNMFAAVPSTIKAALTKKYNKTLMPSFAPPTALKKKKAAALENEFGEEEEESLSDDDTNDDKVENDTLIKMKKPKNSAPSATTSKTTKNGSNTKKTTGGKTTKNKAKK